MPNIIRVVYQRQIKIDQIIYIAMWFKSINESAEIEFKVWRVLSTIIIHYKMGKTINAAFTSNH